MGPRTTFGTAWVLRECTKNAIAKPYRTAITQIIRRRVSNDWKLVKISGGGERGVGSI
jgi:hypothetical protein